MKYKLKEFYAILNERMWNTSERHICTGAERAVQMSVRIHQSWAILAPRSLECYSNI